MPSFSSVAADLIASDRLAEARDACANALAQADLSGMHGRALAVNDLAILDFLEGRTTEALDRLRDAIAQDPRYEPASMTNPDPRPNGAGPIIRLGPRKEIDKKVGLEWITSSRRIIHRIVA